MRITSDEKLVRRLVQAVEKRDRAAFQRLVREQKLGRICHLFCHWVCYVRYRLICRWVCDLELEERPDLVRELTSAGQALSALLERRQVFNEAVAASNENDADKLRAVIEAAGLTQFCHFICFFFCSWRCVLLCLRLCRQFPLVEIEDPLEEAQSFARATQELGQRPAELERLSAAVGAGDQGPSSPSSRSSACSASACSFATDSASCAAGASASSSARRSSTTRGSPTSATSRSTRTSTRGRA